MINIESARPTTKQILEHIEDFELFCMGEKKITPTEFRNINQELSVGAVLMIGTHRFQRDENGKRLIWRSLDDSEYDLGHLHDANVMRDYPGFHSKRSQSLGGESIVDSKIIRQAKGRGSATMVIMKDGSTGIGPDHRMALRNAVLKMHLKDSFNTFSLSNLWKQVWGHA